MTTKRMADALVLFDPSSGLHDLGASLTGALPPGQRFAHDSWNVLSWTRIRGRAREKHVNFSAIRNLELRSTAKIYILHRRMTGKVSGSTACLVLSALKAIDQVISETLPLGELKNKHFHEALEWLVEEASPGAATPVALAGHLTRFGRFLNQHVGLRISFINPLRVVAKHGSSGTEKGRAEQLIPSEVLRDMLALASVSELHLKDQFYRHVLLLFVATGFRLSELFTLSVDCLFDQKGVVGLRYYSVKKGKFEVKPIAAAFAPAVRTAVKWLQDMTAPGREAALKFKLAETPDTPQYDWSYIFRNDLATEYFIGRMLHDWTANPRNNMFNPAGVWFERDKGYIDVLGMLQQSNGNHNAVARQLNTGCQVVVYMERAQQAMLRGELPPNSQRGGEKVDHFADSRFISHSTVERVAGFRIKDKREAKLRPLLWEAQRLQLLGQSYPEPERNPELERTFLRRPQAVLYGRDGKPLLWPHEALFVIEPHTLSYGRQPKKGSYSVIPGNTLVRWLGGEAKAQGTGGVTESIFARFKIRDPRTGDIASFTSHQVRHWLNTMYLQGGFTNEQAAMLMGHDPTVNRTYDQRDFLEREAALKQAVRERHALGHIPDTYLTLVEQDSALAEEFLAATLRRYTVMPYGACTRDLRLNPCPNQLACFADQTRQDGGACPFLIVDGRSPGIAVRLEMLEKEQDLMLTTLPISCPQYAHAKRTKNNLFVFREALNAL